MASLPFLDQPRPAAGITDVVQVDATTRLDINGVDSVDDQLFGVNNAHKPINDQLRAANIRSVRQIIWINKLNPRQDRRRPGYVDPRWWNEINLAKRYDDLFRDYTTLRATGQSIYLAFNQAFAFQPQSKDPKFIYALPVRSSWKGVALFNAEWVRRVNSTTGKPLFDAIEFWNEPDNLWWNRVRSNEAEERAYVQRTINFFLTARPIFRQVVPNVKVGGPSLCGYRWSHWERWLKPFIERAGGEADFITQHWYDPNEGYPIGGMRDDRLEGYLGLVYFSSKHRWGRGLPVAFTEINGTDFKPGRRSLAATRYGNAMLWARLYADVLQHPEKVRGVSHHMPLLGNNPHWPFRLFDIVSPNGEALTAEQTQAMQPEELRYEPWPAYWVFYSLRHLRGSRVSAEASEPIASAATVHSGHLNIWLFNNSGKTRNVEVRVPKVRVGKLEAERLVYDPSRRLGGRFEAFRPVQNGPTTLWLKIAPFSLVQMRLPLPPAANPRPDTRLLQRTYAAKPVGVDLAGRTQPIKMSLDVAPTAVRDDSKGNRVTGELLITTAFAPQQSNVAHLRLQMVGQKERSLTIPKWTKVTRIPVPSAYLKPGQHQLVIIPEGFKQIKDAQLLWVAMETKWLQYGERAGKK